MAARSKITIKAQTVLPQAMHRHLGIDPSGEIELELPDGCTVTRPLRRRSPGLRDDPLAVFTEWGSPADEAAYADL